MNITWYGQTCFRIIAQGEKNGSEPINILIDPLEKGTGLHSPKLEADVLLITSNGKKGPLVVRGISEKTAFLVNGPGEYDIKEAYIQGILASIKDKKGEVFGNTIYVIEVEGIKICHLGLLNQIELNSQQLEKIGDVDILMVPIGGDKAVDAKGAIKIMSQIEPRITIPMYYKLPKLKVKLRGLNEFFKTLGIKSLQSLPKLSIKKKDISQQEPKIIILES